MPSSDSASSERRAPRHQLGSGIGRYRTTIDLGADWTVDDGAFLELGEVNDTFHVRVNGVLLPPCDPMDAVVDLGHALVSGVATRQNYGLVGPVRLVPYVEQVVPA